MSSWARERTHTTIEMQTLGQLQKSPLSLLCGSIAFYNSFHKCRSFTGAQKSSANNLISTGRELEIAHSTNRDIYDSSYHNGWTHGEQWCSRKTQSIHYCNVHCVDIMDWFLHSFHPRDEIVPITFTKLSLCYLDTQKYNVRNAVQYQCNATVTATATLE